MTFETFFTQPTPLERTHPIAESMVPMKNGSLMSAINLADRFYSSSVGSTIPEQPLRYVTKFGYERTDMQLDLGHDVCPMGHQMELVHHLGIVIDRELADSSLLSSLCDEDISLLTFAALTHDIGECDHPSLSKAGFTIVGDIPAGEKTDQDRIHEADIRHFLYATYFNDIDAGFLERVESIVSHKDDSILHEYFEAAHVHQTLETSNFGFFALMRERWYTEGEILDPLSVDGARISGLLGIARVVTQFQTPKALQLAHFKAVYEAIEFVEKLREPKHELLDSFAR